jgi:type II secretory pathway component GspD/PulD (secretin)
VPILGELPFIGLAFRHESKARDLVNLIIFITPTIVQDGDFHPLQTDFLKNKPDESIAPEWSWWDSGKPAVDWSKKQEAPVYTE